MLQYTLLICLKYVLFCLIHPFGLSICHVCNSQRLTTIDTPFNTIDTISTFTTTTTTTTATANNNNNNNIALIYHSLFENVCFANKGVI